MATDPAGAAYVTGAVDSQDGYWKTMVVAKYARNGDQLWKRVWRSHTERYPYSAGSDVAVSPDGDTVYVGGAEFNDSTEAARARLWAYSADGHLVWARVGCPVGRSRSGPWPPTTSARWSAARRAASAGLTTACSPPTTRKERRSGNWNLFEAPGYEGTSDSVEGSPARRQGLRGWIDRYDGCGLRRGPARYLVGCEDIVTMELSTDGAVGWTQVLADPDVKDREEAPWTSRSPATRSPSPDGSTPTDTGSGGRGWHRSPPRGDAADLERPGDPPDRDSSSAVGVSAIRLGSRSTWPDSCDARSSLRSLSLTGSPLTERRGSHRRPRHRASRQGRTTPST